jgi:hypothetical protein
MPELPQFLQYAPPPAPSGPVAAPNGIPLPPHATYHKPLVKLIKQMMRPKRHNLSRHKKTKVM